MADRIRLDVIANVKDATKSINQFKNQTNKSLQSVQKGFSALKSVALSAVAGLAAFAGIRAITQNFLQFEKALAEVKSISGDLIKENKNLASSLISVSEEFGTSAQAQAKAFYQIISAGITDAAAANEVLISANKLAVGGLTETADAVRIITTAINVYGSSVLTAEQVSDSLFTTVKLGVTRVEELASSLGQILPVSRQLGVSLDEVNSAVATLTKRGLSTSEAVTGLNAVFTAVLKKGADAERLFGKKIGDAFNITALRAKGLSTFLEDLTEATGGSEEVLTKLFGRVEGSKAVLSIAVDQFVELNSILSQLENKAGATDAALAEINNTVGQQLNISLAKLNGILLELSSSQSGPVLDSVKILNSSLNGLSFIVKNSTKVFDNFKKRFEETATLDGFIDRAKEISKSLESLSEDAETTQDVIGNFFDLVREGINPINIITNSVNGMAEGFLNLSRDTKKAVDDLSIFGALLEQQQFRKFQQELELQIQANLTRVQIPAPTQAFKNIEKAVENAGLTQVQIVQKTTKRQLDILNQSQRERISAARANATELLNQDSLTDKQRRSINVSLGRALAEIDSQTSETRKLLLVKNETDINKARAAEAKKGVNSLKALITDTFQISDESATAITGSIKSAIAGLKQGGVEGAKAAVVGITSGIATAFLGPIGGIIGEIVGLLAEGPEKVKEIIDSFFNALPTIIENIISAIPQLIISLAENLPILIDRLAEILPPVIEQALFALVRGAPRIIAVLAAKIPFIATRLALALAAQAPFIAQELSLELVKQMPEVAKEFVKELISEMKKAIGSVFDGISGAFGGGGGGGTVGRVAKGFATGGLSEIFKFADGGIVGGSGNRDSELIAATPGELVVSRDDTENLRDFLRNQKQIDNSGILNSILNELRNGDGQNLQVTVQVGEEQLSDVMLNLDRQGFRTSA